MPCSGEPLELQLQRERVARVQVEAALELARLQLIEMEHALRLAREDATACLAASEAADSPPSAEAAPAIEPAPVSLPTKSRIRKPSAKAGSLADVARAAEADEKRSRRGDGRQGSITTMAGMVGGGGAQVLVSTLDLHVDDHRALVTDFIAHLQTRLSKMQACYGSGSMTELKWHVNWISTNASLAGFDALTNPARELEKMIEQHRNERIPDLLDDVIQLGEHVVLEPACR